MTTFDAMAAEAHAEAIATNASRGAQQSFEDGRRAHCPKPPYGVDKLITTDKGDRLWVLRHLPDGSQEQYHARTSELIRTYAPNDGRGGSTHYIKSRQERATLCPGKASLHAHIVRIFTAFDIEKISCEQIAKESNDAKIPSPNGGRWSGSTVHSNLHNPSYLGRGIANQRSNALKVKRSPNAPTRVQRSHAEMVGRRRPPTEMRPREEWLDIEYPDLVDYLSHPLRQIAQRRISKYLDALAAGRTPSMLDRSPAAESFLLSGILRTAQLDLPMRGHLGGGKRAYRTRVRDAWLVSAPSSSRDTEPGRPAPYGGGYAQAHPGACSCCCVRKRELQSVHREQWARATYLLAKAAHEPGIKVALTGEGADEFFGGYHSIRE